MRKTPHQTLCSTVQPPSLAGIVASETIMVIESVLPRHEFGIGLRQQESRFEVSGVVVEAFARELTLHSTRKEQRPHQASFCSSPVARLSISAIIVTFPRALPISTAIAFYLRFERQKGSNLGRNTIWPKMDQTAKS